MDLWFLLLLATPAFLALVAMGLSTWALFWINSIKKASNLIIPKKKVKLVIGIAAVLSLFLLLFSASNLFSGSPGLSQGFVKFDEGVYRFWDGKKQYLISADQKGQLRGFASWKTGEETMYISFIPGNDFFEKPVKKKRSRPKGLTASLTY